MAFYDKDVEELLSQGKTYAAVAEALGITEKQVNHAQQRLKKEVDGDEERLPEIVKKDGYYIVRSNKRRIEITEEKLKLLKDLYCGQRMTINEVCRKIDIPRAHFMVIKTAFSITKGDAPFLDEEFYERDIEELADETLEKQKDLYFIRLQQKEITAMKAELHKYRQQDYQLQKIHEAVTEHFKDWSYSVETEKKWLEPKDNGAMLEVAIFDLHLGKLCWRPETGENFDYKIAKTRYSEVIDDIYYRAEGKALEKILFVVGSDFFHYDTIAVTTTAGTPQDSDLRWHKLYAVGLEMLIEAINRLATLAPVEVIGVPGNHDKQTVYYATHYLNGWYRNTEAVTVSDNLRTRKYIEYGKNLIGFTHGDKEGRRLAELMPVEAATAWGRAKYKEFHIGHLHHEKTQEKNGLIIRNLSSVTGTDAWHYESGFTGSVRKAQSFLWDKAKGLTEIWHTNLE